MSILTVTKRYLQRIKTKYLLQFSFFFGALFLFYQFMGFVALMNDSNVVHPRDLHNKLKFNTKPRSSDNPKIPIQLYNKNNININTHSYHQNSINNDMSPMITEKHSAVKLPSNNLKSSSSDDVGIITASPQPASPEKTFTCPASGTVIAIDKVNDDYCDCPTDGADEYLTNACSNAVFNCKTQSRGFPRKVPSSALNDGVCDCCDGSDEPSGHILPNPQKDARGTSKLRVMNTPCVNRCNR